MGISFGIDNEPTNIHSDEGKWETKANKMAKGQRVKEVIYTDGVVAIILESGTALIVGARYTAIGVPR